MHSVSVCYNLNINDQVWLGACDVLTLINLFDVIMNFIKKYWHNMHRSCAIFQCFTISIQHPNQNRNPKEK